MGGLMGRIVYAAAMSHVLYPDYYGENVGPHGRKMVEELIEVVRDMGRTLAAAAPDALVVVADDHLNVFAFDAVPALCVRVGRSGSRMVQDDAIEFDRALDGWPERYPVHEDLANAILEQGLQAGFDFAASWSAPLDHAFLSPVSTLYGDRPVPPLVPFWVNCFVAPQPTAQRCFAAGRHIARVVADGPRKVAVIATGGLSHFPELSVARVGQSDPAFDRRVVNLMKAGDHATLAALTAKELHDKPHSGQRRQLLRPHPDGGTSDIGTVFRMTPRRHAHLAAFVHQHRCRWGYSTRWPPAGQRRELLRLHPCRRHDRPWHRVPDGLEWQCHHAAL